MTVMQVHGSFPYKISAASDYPTFSLCICLWAFFMQLNTIMFSVRSLLIFLFGVELDLGNVVFSISAFSMSMTLGLTPSVVSVRSSRLARLIHDMSVKRGASMPPPSHRWRCRPQTLTLLTILTVFTIANTYLTITIMDIPVYIGVLVFVPMSLTVGISYFLPGTFSAMLFGCMTHRLVAATEGTVAKVSMLLAHDGSFKSENDVEAALLALRHLDTVIQEV